VSQLIFFKFDFVTISLKNHNLAKSRNFRLRSTKRVFERRFLGIFESRLAIFENMFLK